MGRDRRETGKERGGREGPATRVRHRCTPPALPLPLACALQETCEYVACYAEPKQAVDALVTESYKRWMKEEQVVDDTTIIVAHLDVNARNSK